MFFGLKQNVIAQNQTLSTFVPEIGFPLVHNFSSDEYNGASQNWAIAQSTNGFIYVGNNGGVLEFDGKNWRRYETANQSTVKSLAINKKGEIFVGAKGELGILKPDSTNTLKYISLLYKIPEDKRNFNDVWQIFIDEEQQEVYFRTVEQILIYKNGVFIKIIESKNKFGTSFFANNNFYVRDAERGLLKLNEDYELEEIAGQIVGGNNIYGVISKNQQNKEKNIIVLTRPEGVFEIKNKKSTQINFSALSTLNETKGYASILLPTQEIAIATLRNGVFITDLNGNIKLHLNKENILKTNTIYNLFLDKQNNLWLATGNGISCVYLSIPYSTIGEKQGVEGKGLTANYSEIYNKLYLGTTLGIYQNDYPNSTNSIDGNQKAFSLLRGTEGYGLFATSDDNKVYQGHNLGIFEIVDTVANQLAIAKKAIWTIKPISTESTTRFLTLPSKGISLFTKKKDTKNEEWKEQKYSNFKENVQDLIQYEGYWWTKSNNKGVFRFTFSENYDSLLEAKLYATDEGLLSKIGNHIYKIRDRLVVVNENTILKYNAKTDEFIKDNFFEDYFQTKKIRYLYEDKNKNIWYRIEGEKGVLWKEKNAYKKQSDIVALQSLYNEITSTQMLSDGKLVLGVENGFLFIDTKRKLEVNQKPTVEVRKIELLGENDSLLFGGVFFDADSLITYTQPNNQKLKLNYDLNALRFSFASPDMSFPEQTEYRYKLDGLDEKWSTWSSKTHKEYTNLPDKNYKFRVQARTVWGVESEEVVYEFGIDSPFYKTWSAYIIYTILIALIVWLIVRLNTKRLERDKKKLEKTITERTIEIVQQKEELQLQADNLSKANVAINNQKEELELQAENLSLANTAINEQKQEIEKSYQNVRILSQIGQKITNILDVQTLIQTVYENINTLMPADGFGIGILNNYTGKIDFEGFIENDEILPAHSDNINDTTKLSVRSLKNNQRLVINDLQSQYKEYFNTTLEDVEVGKLPYSLVYLPLSSEGEIIGVLSVQSMKKHEYSSLELDMLDTLGAYTAIALDNIKAYQIISTKNTNITDSIRYAQTIQQAVLPIEEELKAYFEEHFVIFRPKDIVSGDFYWATETKDKLFVAVVDCTGHGVPGAFMSMLGHTFLNEAVSQQNLTDPAAILEWLNKEIKISLRQEQKANADGMDISLCVIDKNKTQKEEIKITYCGAKRPLFYVLPTSELKIIKGVRRSIGEVSRRKKYINFENHEVNIPKGTMLYFFSDGFSDQSNPNGAKLGTTQVLEILPDLAAMAIEEQKQKLIELLDNHQQETPQRDDITFMGVRI
ncbi:SpoIIE family protein phosphatase [Bernardetia litoralis]|uniref:SpoIIE family protein phosphatase n=1 Tax=Bernardetia litoralis TaxID=999 RepID=UPI0002F0C57B|nr:SpoIIE family protein phosphatase [Bernardetia litoralis]